MKCLFTILFIAMLPAAAVSAQTSFQQLGGRADSLSAPRFEFLNGIRHDYGNVPDDGKPLEHEFHFRNAGRQPLLITNVNGSAGNMMAEWPKEAIAPGRRGKIKTFITYPKGSGSLTFSKTYFIHANAPSDHEQATLYIKGNIVPDATEK